MKPKTLWKCSVSTTAIAEEPLTELLRSLFEIDPVVTQNTQTGHTSVAIYSPRQSDVRSSRRAQLSARIRELRAHGIPVGTGRIKVQKVKAEDWTESWKKHFQPWEPGKTLLVKPSWSKIKPRKGQAVLTLDPGLSFGTGQHATTRFCLRQLVRLRQPDQIQSLLDIGTGSGILAIGAALLGYGPVRGYDFDPDAVRVAKTNARVNRAQKKVSLTEGDVLHEPLKGGEKYDVVCANLMADLLIAARDRISNRVKPDGSLVLAGILSTQFESVEKAFRKAGWRLVRARTEREWRSGLWVRKGDARA